MSQDIVRVLRVIEYVGGRIAVEHAIKNAVHGIKVIGGENGPLEIRAATLGLVPDILEMGRVEELLPPI